MELDLNLMRVFCTVYEQGSVTAAATELHLTQPTVSHSLKKLRRQCNDQLFVREGRGLRPTPFAASIFPQVKAGIAQVSSAMSSGGQFDPVTARDRFTLALTDLGERAFLPPVMTALRRQAPGTELTVLPLDVEHIPDDLLRNRVDAAICAPYIGGPDIVRTVIGTDDYVIIAARDHPRIRDELTLEQLAVEPRIRLAPSLGHDLAEVAAEQAGAPGRTALRLSRFTGLLAVVERTDCIAVLPRLLAATLEETSGIRVFAHPVEMPPLQLAVYAREPGHQRPAQRWFAQLLVDVLLETFATDPSAPLRPGPVHGRPL
ncbi:LysR family transcriptional regulator [Kocuria sp. M1R5S2]|uniref:LysR family transcriptional regulator n=1 Tax=Kocuria rhizosphaerae TaxID=3376285 RepID=UPI0037B9EEBC